MRKTWKGDDSNVQAAQERLLFLAKNNSLATLGQFENTSGEKKVSL